MTTNCPRCSQPLWRNISFEIKNNRCQYVCAECFDLVEPKIASAECTYCIDGWLPYDMEFSTEPCSRPCPKCKKNGKEVVRWIADECPICFKPMCEFGFKINNDRSEYACGACFELVEPKIASAKCTYCVDGWMPISKLNTDSCPKCNDVENELDEQTAIKNENENEIVTINIIKYEEQLYKNINTIKKIS
jgi:hypothetical protein